MKKFLLTLVAAGMTLAAAAQKQLYIPAEWKNPWKPDSLLYKESDPDGKYTWSKTRSRESENFICYWDKGYGSKAPDELSKSNFYYVDIDDLLKKAESFYALNIGRLAFCNEAHSNVSKYKMMILMNHSEEWICYGGGYDDLIGALWLNPSTCKPVGHSVAHEVGHSFQYQCFADLKGHAGFRDAVGAGSAFWEQTAQWQAAQAYPEEKWNQSWSIFHNTANYAMTHEWMRYQSYWWHYFLVERYGIDIIGRLWRNDTGKTSQDPNQSLMNLLGISVRELYKLYFDYAMKMATLDIDLDNIRNEAAPYIGTYTYKSVPLGGTKYQVAYASCPQSTGFNVIPLSVPTAGTIISTDFTSLQSRANLAADDPKEYFNGESRFVTKSGAYYNITESYNSARGFRLGYVALLSDGSRRYLYEDSLYCADDTKAGEKTVTLTATVPEQTERLFLVVVPAPRRYYQHQWDDAGRMNETQIIANDDQWPYTVEFHNTNLLGQPVISDQLGVTDATLTFDVNLPRHATDHSFVPVTLNDARALAALGTAFQMPAAELPRHLAAWSSAAPAEDEMKFYAVNPATGSYVNAGATAYEPGHWFNANGARCDYGSGYVFSEFQPNELAFKVGQFPGRLTVGKTYTISQALRYRKGGTTATVRFIFRVHCVAADAQASCVLADVKQDDRVIDYITGISSPIGTAICTPNKKVMENGQVMIYRNGRRYNTLGVGTELDF